MALIILEGLDRTGKSTVAEEFKKQGYEIIHMSAPPKALFEPGYTGPSYLDLMLDQLQAAASKDILLDRSHYGELVWPSIYNRVPALKGDDYDILREIEDSVGVQRILMVDSDVEAHWNRCVANKEPLTKLQFIQARAAFDKMATKYGFERKTLKDFVDVKPLSKSTDNAHLEKAGHVSENSVSTGNNQVSTPPASGQTNSGKTELQKLELANAINDVLSKRILKSKNPVYDQLETDIRDYLNKRLGKIFGDDKSNDLTKEEIATLKLFVKRFNEKERK